MIHIPETLTMKTGDIAILIIGAFCIGVAIVCFIWIGENEKAEKKEKTDAE